MLQTFIPATIYVLKKGRETKFDFDFTAFRKYQKNKTKQKIYISFLLFLGII